MSDWLKRAFSNQWHYYKLFSPKLDSGIYGAPKSRDIIARFRDSGDLARLLKTTANSYVSYSARASAASALADPRFRAALSTSESIEALLGLAITDGGAYSGSTYGTGTVHHNRSLLVALSKALAVITDPSNRSRLWSTLSASFRAGDIAIKENVVRIIEAMNLKDPDAVRVLEGMQPLINRNAESQNGLAKHLQYVITKLTA